MLRDFQHYTLLNEQMAPAPVNLIVLTQRSSQQLVVESANTVVVVVMVLSPTSWPWCLRFYFHVLRIGEALARIWSIVHVPAPAQPRICGRLLSYSTHHREAKLCSYAAQKLGVLVLRLKKH